MVSIPFSDIVGQGQAIQLLKQAIACKRIAPAYLFVGPHGVGRSRVARGFLDLLISAEVKQPKSSSQQDNHPDILWIEPTYSIQGKLVSVSELAAQGGTPPKARPQIRLAQVRQITRFLAQSPWEAARLLVVLEQVESLGEAAANGLLKTLEEPGKATLILIAPSTETLLPTLVSRCQRIPFSRLTTLQMQQVLTQVGHPDLLAHPQILAIAQGSPGAAIAHWQRYREISADLLQACQFIPKSLRACLELARQIDGELDTAAQLWLLDYLQQHYWSQYVQADPIRIFETAKQRLQSYAQSRLVWEVAFLDLYDIEKNGKGLVRPRSRGNIPALE